MQVTLREQKSIAEPPKQISFGLVLVGPLSVTHTSPPIWLTPYSKFSLPDNSEFVRLDAGVWRTHKEFSATSSADVFAPDVAYDGPRDRQFHVIATTSLGAPMYSSAVKRATFSEGNLYSLELESSLPLPNEYSKLHLVSFERMSFSDLTPNNDGSFSVDLGPMFPLPPAATVTYRALRDDVPCVRIYKDTRHLYSNPVLDRLPDFDQLLFVNTNCGTSDAHRHISPYDYYFVPTDGGEASHALIDELTAGRGFFHMFASPPAPFICADNDELAGNALDPIVGFVV